MELFYGLKVKLKEINPDKIKFTFMNVDDFEISFDRLTRFKYTEKKYLRVFGDIVTKHLVSPKLSKSDIANLEPIVFGAIVEKIWNDSLKSITKKITNDRFINELLRCEELQAYNVPEEILCLLDKNIDYLGTLGVIRKCKNLPLNLKRLIVMQSHLNENKEFLREKYALKFPVEKVVLCEGITEEILLPKFASVYGYDFNKFGVHLISAGGKNQVARLYCELKDELKLPIFILLDADAKATSETIKNILRDKDKIYLIKHGEFEDIFSLTLIKRTINNCYKNILKASVAEFRRNMPMTKTLSDYYRENQLGDYQKADFAKQLHSNINGKNDLTEEIVDIIESIKSI